MNEEGIGTASARVSDRAQQASRVWLIARAIPAVVVLTIGSVASAASADREVASTELSEAGTRVVEIHVSMDDSTQTYKGHTLRAFTFDVKYTQGGAAQVYGSLSFDKNAKSDCHFSHDFKSSGSARLVKECELKNAPQNVYLSAGMKKK